MPTFVENWRVSGLRTHSHYWRNLAEIVENQCCILTPDFCILGGIQLN